MPKFKKLRAPKGTDEANFDGGLYRVDNDGTVSVPEAAVADLLKTGGFTAEDESGEVPGDLVLMSAPAGATGCSWDSVEYEVDDLGNVEVPAGAVGDLVAHGFVSVEAKPDAKKPAIPKLKLT